MKKIICLVAGLIISVSFIFAQMNTAVTQIMWGEGNTTVQEQVGSMNFSHIDIYRCSNDNMVTTMQGAYKNNARIKIGPYAENNNVNILQNVLSGVHPELDGFNRAGVRIYGADDNSVLIDQSGRLNKAFVNTSSYDSESNTTMQIQKGLKNLSNIFIEFKSYDNVVETYQGGFGNIALVNLYDSKENHISIKQNLGTPFDHQPDMNLAEVEICNGMGNIDDIIQEGKCNEAFVRQVGDWNSATIMQNGYAHHGIIIQKGCRNSSTIIQRDGLFCK